MWYLSSRGQNQSIVDSDKEVEESNSTPLFQSFSTRYMDFSLMPFLGSPEHNKTNDQSSIPRIRVSPDRKSIHPANSSVTGISEQIPTIQVKSSTSFVNTNPVKANNSRMKSGEQFSKAISALGRLELRFSERLKAKKVQKAEKRLRKIAAESMKRQLEQQKLQEEEEKEKNTKVSQNQPPKRQSKTSVPDKSSTVVESTTEKHNSKKDDSESRPIIKSSKTVVEAGKEHDTEPSIEKPSIGSSVTEVITVKPDTEPETSNPKTPTIEVKSDGSKKIERSKKPNDLKSPTTLPADEAHPREIQPEDLDKTVSNKSVPKSVVKSATPAKEDIAKATEAPLKEKKWSTDKPIKPEPTNTEIKEIKLKAIKDTNADALKNVETTDPVEGVKSGNTDAADKPIKPTEVVKQAQEIKPIEQEGALPYEVTQAEPNEPAKEAEQVEAVKSVSSPTLAYSEKTEISKDQLDHEGSEKPVVMPENEKEIVEELNDPNSGLSQLFTSKHTARDDPSYPAARLVHFKEIARQIYDGTYKEADPKEYLTLLGGGKPLPDSAPLDIDIMRYFYMSNFRWDYNLLSSLRILCDKLFFKGESQDIDKILDAFSQSWFEVFGICNGNSLYGNANGVYLVAYSLVILNTDMHTKNKNGNKTKRISKSRFVKNTATALRQNTVPSSNEKMLEKELKEFYVDLQSHELRLAEEAGRQLDNGKVIKSKGEVPHMLKSRPSISSFFSRNSDRDDDDLSMYSSADPTTEKVKSSFGFAKAMRAEEALKSIDTTRNSLYSFGAGSMLTMGSTNASILTRFSSGAAGPLDPDSSFLSGEQLTLDLNDPYFIEEDGDVELELEGPPWVKEGIQKVILTRSVLQSMKNMSQNGTGSIKGSLSALNDRFHSNFHFSGQRTPWKEYFTVVSEGQLRLFLFDESTSGGVTSASTHGNGNWMEFAKCIASVTLNSCYAQIVHPNSKLYSHILRHMQRVTTRADDATFWVLNLPLNDSEQFKNYRRVFFCSETSENAAEFCETCNFWAARTSSIPPEEAISSVEYGWSTKILSFLNGPQIVGRNKDRMEQYLASASVQKWKPIVYGLIPSDESMIEQLKDLKQYYCELELTYRHHKELEVFHMKLDSFAGGARRGAGRSNLFARRNDNTAKNVQIIRKNYLNRLNYLCNELIKFKTYVFTLEKAIILRRKRLVEIDKKNNIIKEEDEGEEEEIESPDAKKQSDDIQKTQSDKLSTEKHEEN